MLTDTALRNLKPKSKIYKAFDRDGMCVTVSPAGTVTFRYDYRLNGRRETLTIGRYGPAGISLALAREKLLDAKRAVAQGKSPAHEKQREKRRLMVVKTFGDMTGRWLADARMADSTRSMRKSIIDRDLLPAFQNRLLTEISPDDLRALCNKVKARGAPATAVHIRDIVKQINVESSDADRVRARQGRGFAAGTVHGPRPAPYRLDATQRGRLQRRLDREGVGARGWALLALGLQQGGVRRTAALHAAGVGGHGRCLDRWTDLCAEADAGKCIGAGVERKGVAERQVRGGDVVGA